MPKTQKSKALQIPHDSEVLQGLARGPWALYWGAKYAGYDKDGEAFGCALGAQVTGSGVRWDDNLRHNQTGFKIRVPSTEFYQGANIDLRFVHE